MGSLKNEILHALKKSDSTNEILDKISNYQNVLMKNYNNQILSKEIKNKLLDIHTELQNLGKAIYRCDKFAENNFENEFNTEIDNVKELLLKVGISNLKYIWHSEKGEHTCDECAELDGQEFDMFDDIPEKPHPNCQCTIDMIEDNSEGGGSAEDEPKPVSKETKIPQSQKTNNTMWIMPCTGKITSPFGWRVHPVYKTGKMHNGWDIAVPVGTPIKAVADGKVYYAGKADGYGKMVVIIHHINGKIFTSEYGHISSWNVYSGQQIKQGQVVAKSGNEGVSSGPHLHLTIRKGPYRGTAVDPGEYIKD